MNNVSTSAYGKKMAQPFVGSTDLQTLNLQTTESVTPSLGHLISDHDFTVRLNDAVKSSQEDRKAPSLRELFRGIQQIVRE
ncbi:MAG TPA: hypothetical protein VNU92_12745 [Edaphobacter sp.]|jgi:hypothetical protein|nr:hypothetical protein [Edaphobacter sp.]